MKNYITLFLLLCADVFFAGCSKPEETQTPKQILVPFNVSASQDKTPPSAASRAILEGNTAKWVLGDRVGLYAASYASSGGSQFSLTADNISTDGKSAWLSGEGAKPADVDTFYAVYPSTATIASGTAAFTIAANQLPALTPELLMAARTADVSKDNLSLHFKVINSFLYLTMPAGMSSVAFSGCGGESIAGRYLYDFGSQTAAVSGTTSIRVDNPGTQCYLVIPAMTFGNGFKLVFTDNTGAVMAKTYRYGREALFEASKYYDITAAAFVPTVVNVTTGDTATTSLSLWVGGNVAAANAWTGDKARFSGSFSGATAGMIDECGVTIDGVEYKGTVNAGTQTFTVDATGLAWKTNTATAYVKIGSRKFTAANTADAQITGLPYHDIMTNSTYGGKWTEVTNNLITWTANGMIWPAGSNLIETYLFFNVPDVLLDGTDFRSRGINVSATVDYNKADVTKSSTVTIDMSIGVRYNNRIQSSFYFGAGVYPDQTTKPVNDVIKYSTTPSSTYPISVWMNYRGMSVLTTRAHVVYR